MDKKDFFIIILKTLAYMLGLILTSLGVVALTSCSVTKDTNIVGKATIVTTDTTYIYHNTFIKFPKTK